MKIIQTIISFLKQLFQTDINVDIKKENNRVNEIKRNKNCSINIDNGGNSINEQKR